jgi:protein tyrosine phosphatase (PTP) superfamily phosphohydrolase (DUF442 family)
MSRPWHTAAGTAVVLGLIIGPAIFAEREIAHKRNFRVVRDRVLYRSGRMTRDALKRVLNDYGIRTVICLRDGSTAPDRDEEAFCNSEEVNYVRIPPNSWEEWGGEAPAEEGVRKFRQVMSDPRNYPVLLHCLAGIHRTGIFTAVYRMEFEHWSNDRAMQEMRACGYVELDDHLDVVGYLEQYQPQWSKADTATPPPPPGPHSYRRVPHSVRAMVTSVHGTAGVKAATAAKPHQPKRRTGLAAGHRTRSHSAPPVATTGAAAPAAQPASSP